MSNATLRKATERGHADHGWLDSHHTFSFAGYYDPDQMGFRRLRVINEDRVQPSKGFGTHPHRDMEIVSIVLEGELAHEDSLGNGSVIRPGDVQRMSAGSGILHSEFNNSSERLVHFLQIWIEPNRRGLEPGYEQKHFAPEERRDRLVLVGSEDGREGSLTIHQDVSLYVSKLSGGAELRHELAPQRHAWVQVTSGQLEVRLGAERYTLSAGDGLRVSDQRLLDFASSEGADFILFDLA
ncbi:MAG TPA: quercetin 2,3-dioxygenase [Planctomycetes bacterium]|nr:quercetin 2,3-dioxygenase [Planctomycetota bacterium]